LLVVIVFQSQPVISPTIPIRRNLSVVTILQTWTSCFTEKWYSAFLQDGVKPSPGLNIFCKLKI
jgi:hypothetical protein